MAVTIVDRREKVARVGYLSHRGAVLSQARLSRTEGTASVFFARSTKHPSDDGKYHPQHGEARADQDQDGKIWIFRVEQSAIGKANCNENKCRACCQTDTDPSESSVM
jgi:hypothetical protein